MKKPWKIDVMHCDLKFYVPPAMKNRWKMDE
jgi:hypothetical protein